MFRMKGVIPPMITPFKENGEVDYEGLSTLAGFLKDKVDGLFITGSYGSAALLQVEERKKIAQTVMETVGDAIPVIVHVGTADSLSAAELAVHAKSLGAAAVSAFPLPPRHAGGKRNYPCAPDPAWLAVTAGAAKRSGQAQASAVPALRRKRQNSLLNRATRPSQPHTNYTR